MSIWSSVKDRFFTFTNMSLEKGSQYLEDTMNKQQMLPSLEDGPTRRAYLNIQYSQVYNVFACYTYLYVLFDVSDHIIFYFCLFSSSAHTICVNCCTYYLFLCYIFTVNMILVNFTYLFRKRIKILT